MNLLERMAEALRHEHEGNKDALASLMERGIYDGVDDDAKRQMDEVDALLAEYERDQKRIVVLKFEKVNHPTAGTRMMVLFPNVTGNDAQVYDTAHPEDDDYAFAPLPPVPGPEVFK